MSTSPQYISNKTTDFFIKANKMWSIVGLSNLWIDNQYNQKRYRYVHNLITLFIFILISSELGALFTQSNLTEKQSNDLILFTITHPILISYYLALEYYNTKAKYLFIMLNVELKKAYNDLHVETRMIKRATFFSFAYLLCLTIALGTYAFDSFVQVIRSEGSFTTVITAWPDVDNNTILANLVRVINYIVWWALMLRVTAVSTFIIIASVSVSYQYKNLQSYFYSLNDLFQLDANERDHKENELKYVEALKVGIRLHSDTLWCTKLCQVTCSLIVSGQIIINISILCLLMLQLVASERTLMNAVTIVSTGIAVLTSTALLMLNAGDISYEAALVPTAMYSSGWQHCRGAISTKVRRLLVVAVMRGQEPVIFRSFGIIEISYQSFVSIVKASYSIFSLLY
ncbi:unnamed protein product [Euphydryas editha]|uniref:Odorant receptor n=1 Tax=Euphydryas editha TaxID=104508 RepID=A0AAU9V024_EUPED|nr:unnamed protein product [Euphydryas editha]